MRDVAELEELARASDNQPLVNLRLGVIPLWHLYILQDSQRFNYAFYWP